MTDEPASVILLKASAVMAIEPESIPAVSFPAKRSMLRKIPKILQSMPKARLPASVVISLLLKKIDETISKIILEKAWQEGHAYGYHEVNLHIDELAEMVEKIIKAVK